MSLVTINIDGLAEVQEYFSEKRIKQAVSKGIGIATLQLHKELKTAVENRYTARNDLEKQLVKSKSTVTFGKNLIKKGLEYKIQYSDLSKFRYSARYGALNRGMGWVHTVEVVRGRRFVVKGKEGRGGFTPRIGSSSSKHGQAKRIFRGGSQMLERKSSKSLPLRVLYGPSTRDMILRELKKNTKVSSVLDALSNDITKFID